MGLLDGKRIVITGVLTDASIAFGVARLAQEQGAEIVLTGAGRGLSLTERTARKLPSPPPVLELDVTEPDHLVSVREDLAERWGRVDGVLHAIGFAPAVCLGGTFMEATWDDVSVALHVSTYSLKALVDAFGPLMDRGSALVGLDFDATVAWPAYDWMGVAKAALESTSRYLARELGSRGIRVNLVAAGPLRTMAAKSIPGFSAFEDVLAGPRSARLGHHRHRARRPGLRRLAQRLVPGHDGRDGPRGRRLPRHRRLRLPAGQGQPGTARRGGARGRTRGGRAGSDRVEERPGGVRSAPARPRSSARPSPPAPGVDATRRPRATRRCWMPVTPRPSRLRSGDGRPAG